MVSSILENLYSKLQDEESRFIFETRLSSFLNNDYSNFIKLQEYIQSINKDFYTDKWNSIFDLPKFYSPTKRVIMYGAGIMARYHLDTLTVLGIKVSCLCDSNQEKWNTVSCGLTVISPDFLDNKHDLVCISTTSRFHDEIAEALINRGFLKEQIFLAIYEPQYFCPSIFTPLDNEYYIDAGCFDGETIKDFINFCDGKYSMIYGFEPSDNWFSKTQNLVENEKFPNVKLYKKGVWSDECSLSFINVLSAGSRISSQGNTSIQCTSIDSVVKDDPITFIKMDIEGAELEALKGAANTIRKHKPRLAICIYHKLEDILEIPLFILELVPEYRFHIRHHSVSIVETVLYAQI